MHKNQAQSTTQEKALPTIPEQDQRQFSKSFEYKKSKGIALVHYSSSPHILIMAMRVQKSDMCKDKWSGLLPSQNLLFKSFNMTTYWLHLAEKARSWWQCSLRKENNWWKRRRRGKWNTTEERSRSRRTRLLLSQSKLSEREWSHTQTEQLHRRLSAAFVSSVSAPSCSGARDVDSRRRQKGTAIVLPLRGGGDSVRPCCPWQCLTWNLSVSGSCRRAQISCHVCCP